MLQTSVEIVKPGGTGRPAFVISARPAPLPPSRSFMLRLPSAFPLPKKYTYFFAFPVLPALVPACPALFPARFFDMLRSPSVVRTWCPALAGLLIWCNFRYVCDIQDC